MNHPQPSPGHVAQEIWIEESEDCELTVAIDLTTHQVTLERFNKSDATQTSSTHHLSDIVGAGGDLGIAYHIAVAHIRIAEIKDKEGLTWWR